MAEPKHGTSPMVIDETPGKKAYCQCGLSENLPYCDGSHSREESRFQLPEEGCVVNDEDLLTSAWVCHLTSPTGWGLSCRIRSVGDRVERAIHF